jgi:uncharacterized membrane protein YagU involved in acid resistance
VEMNYTWNAGRFELNSSKVYTCLCPRTMHCVPRRLYGVGSAWADMWLILKEISFAIKHFTGKLFERDYFKILSEIYGHYTQCSP